MLHGSMSDERNADDDLARDIGFALWRSPFRLKRDQGIDAYRFIARAVVEHLKRCGWQFTHRSLPGGPSSHRARREN
jgi:hypothetical protein